MMRVVYIGIDGGKIKKKENKEEVRRKRKVQKNVAALKVMNHNST